MTALTPDRACAAGHHWYRNVDGTWTCINCPATGGPAPVTETTVRP